MTEERSCCSAAEESITTTSTTSGGGGTSHQVVVMETAATSRARFRQRQVSFNNIYIHEHPVVLGDNPGGISGPPLTIDWNAQRSIAMPLDDYEKGRPEEARRNKYQFTLPEMVRIDMLKQSGYSRQEIARLTAPVNRAREQRKASCRASKIDGLLECKETVSRALVNVLTLGRRKRAERLFLEQSRRFDRRHEEEDDLEKEDKEGTRSSIRTTQTSQADSDTSV